MTWVDKNLNTIIYGDCYEIIKQIPDNSIDCIYTDPPYEFHCGVVDIGDGRYRYLTELECWRLMGFSDEDFYNALKANPSKQGKMNGALYKQAGNSIPVPILEAIFSKLLLNKIQEQSQLKLF